MSLNSLLQQVPLDVKSRHVTILYCSWLPYGKTCPEETVYNMKELVVKIDNGNYMIGGGYDWGNCRNGEPRKYEANEVRSEFYEELLSYHYDYHMQVTIPFDGSYNIVFKHPGDGVVCVGQLTLEQRLNAGAENAIDLC